MAISKDDETPIEGLGPEDLEETQSEQDLDVQVTEEDEDEGTPDATDDDTQDADADEVQGQSIDELRAALEKQRVGFLKEVDKKTAKLRAAERDIEFLRAKYEAIEARDQERERKERERESQSARSKLDSEIGDLESEIRESMEIGNAERVMTLQRQLRDKEFKRWEMDNRPTPQEPATTQTKPPEPSQQDAPEGLHPAAQAFIDRTKWWGDNPKAEKAAIQIEESLLDKGYKRSEELYQEVEKQLKKRYPRLYGIKPNSPVTPDDKSHGDTSNRVTRRPKGYGETKESMSSEHLAIMRKYGLDPNKLKDRRAFVQEAWSGETNT